LSIGYTLVYMMLRGVWLGESLNAIKIYITNSAT